MTTSISTQDQWQKTIADFQKSGLSGAAFCKAHDVVYANFNYWKKRFRTTARKKITPKPLTQVAMTHSLPSFLELSHKPLAKNVQDMPGAWHIVLKLGNGVELCLNPL